MDTDAVFTCLSRSIESLILDEIGGPKSYKEAIVAREETTFDGSFINTGVFLVKNSVGGRALLEGSAQLFDQHQVKGRGAQNAIQHYVFGRDTRGLPMSERDGLEEEMRPEIALADQRVMNSFVWAGDPLSEGTTHRSEWQPGDFVAHIASRDAGLREALIINVTRGAWHC